MRHIKAKAYFHDGTRAVLNIVCSGRSAAEQIVDTLYPEAARVSIIQLRGVAAC